MSSQDEGKFYPTPLLIQLSRGGGGGTQPAASDLSASASTANDDNEGFLVVETNFRLYAYTESPMRIAITALFCEMLYRFPTVAVGVITRQSVQQALQNGIHAAEIISFIETRAHAQMRRRPPPQIPPSISDQIYLWEKEFRRYVKTDGVLYSSFDTQNQYDILRQHVQSIGSLLFANDERRVVVAEKSAHDSIKQFWKRVRKDNELNSAYNT